MDKETHLQQLKEAFPGEKINTVQGEFRNLVNAKFNRELTRLEVGHLFSLGLDKIKRSGEGITVTFDLSKTHLNSIFKND